MSQWGLGFMSLGFLHRITPTFPVTHFSGLGFSVSAPVNFLRLRRCSGTHPVAHLLLGTLGLRGPAGRDEAHRPGRRLQGWRALCLDNSNSPCWNPCARGRAVEGGRRCDFPDFGQPAMPRGGRTRAMGVRSGPHLVTHDASPGFLPSCP